MTASRSRSASTPATCSTSPPRSAARRAEFRFAEHAAGATVIDPALVLDPTDAGVQYVLMPLRA